MPVIPPKPTVSPMAAQFAAMRGKGWVPAYIPPHVIVKARAGTGKTTTLIGGMKVMKDLDPGMVPSAQQKAVWDMMAKSRGARYVGFCAFNASIARELKTKVPAGCDAMTIHRMGMRTVRKAFGLPMDDNAVNEHRTSNILAELLGVDIRDLRKQNPMLVRAVDDLVAHCKLNLMGAGFVAGCGREPHPEGPAAEMDWLVQRFGVEFKDRAMKEQVYDLVPKVIDRAKDVCRDGCIDHNDMIWLPLALGIPVFRYTVLFVDEAQDLNACQQGLVLAAAWRLVLCGDDKQSIYGFTGADTESLPRMYKILSATKAGCQVLPLTVTRRCGKRIVKEAQTLVPDFESFPDAHEGKVTSARFPVQKTGYNEMKVLKYEETYMPLVEDGDMILCRANAPLVSQCLAFLKRKRRAFIQGRKIGEGLAGFVKHFDAIDVPDLIEKCSDWEGIEVAKENAERFPSQNKLQMIWDKADCIRAFCSGAKSIEEVIGSIYSVFEDGDTPGIKLSSIHKAKGLEANRVFYIEGFGPPMDKLEDWEVDQEYNMRYVAITRAIHELVYVN